MPLQVGVGDDAEYLAEAIVSCYGKLSILKTLEPTPETNNAFEELVDLCSNLLSPRVVAKVGTHSRQVISQSFPGLIRVRCWTTLGPFP